MREAKHRGNRSRRDFRSHSHWLAATVHEKWKQLMEDEIAGYYYVA